MCTNPKQDDWKLCISVVESLLRGTHRYFEGLTPNAWVRFSEFTVKSFDGIEIYVKKNLKRQEITPFINHGLRHKFFGTILALSPVAVLWISRVLSNSSVRPISRLVSLRACDPGSPTMSPLLDPPRGWHRPWYFWFASTSRRTTQ